MIRYFTEQNHRGDPRLTANFEVLMGRVAEITDPNLRAEAARGLGFAATLHLLDLDRSTELYPRPDGLRAQSAATTARAATSGGRHLSEPDDAEAFIDGVNTAQKLLNGWEC